LTTARATDRTKSASAKLRVTSRGVTGILSGKQADAEQRRDELL
jgi:hypothetical protein